MHICCIDLNNPPAYREISKATSRNDIAVVFGEIEIAMIDMLVGRAVNDNKK